MTESLSDALTLFCNGKPEFGKYLEKKNCKYLDTLPLHTISHSFSFCCFLYDIINVKANLLAFLSFFLFSPTLLFYHLFSRF